MDPLERVEQEHEIVTRLRKTLEGRGWLVEKTHGSMYAVGWPDLFCHHPQHGSRWIEVKRPHKGALEDSQIKKFRRWLTFGLGVYVLVDDSKTQLDLLLRAPNWTHWTHKDTRAASQPRKVRTVKVVRRPCRYCAAGVPHRTCANS